MPQPQRFEPTEVSIGKRRCANCGVPMFLAQIEPSEQDGHDERTFECTKCAYAEIVIVKFR
jgi:ribosomal protein S27AE